jgi:hypothetical protein
MDKQTERQKDGQSDGHTYIQTSFRHVHGRNDELTVGQKSGQTDRHLDGKNNELTDGQTDRQTRRWKTQ